MWLFRKSLDLRQAQPRILGTADLTAVSRLLRDGARRMFALSGGELPALVAAGYGAGLWIGADLVAVVVVSWPGSYTCWLRALALSEGADPASAFDLLLPLLHTHLTDRGIQFIYYAGDEDNDNWLIPVLKQHRYLPDTEVVVYEKRTWNIPDEGNQDVILRVADSNDLAAVLALDQVCFEQQWTKDSTILGPAILDGPFFVIAELDDVPVGYAYATSHFGGRLLHLVRIAVDPQAQGKQIGIRLLAEVTHYAIDHRSDVVTLNTQSYNSHAQRLYEWFGFRRTGERQQILRLHLTEPVPPTA